MRFAIIGAAGFVAPRHMKAIVDTGHEIVCAVDPNDSVGVLDKYGYGIEFFTDFDRFTRHLERHPVDWVSVCSPNYLHDIHTKAALRAGANVICEKPLVLSPWNLDALARVEEDAQRRVYTVLQLRLHPKLIALRDALRDEPHRVYDVALDYVTPRGRWYDRSWKADTEKSGGVATNIGIHLFDLLTWLFGPLDFVVDAVVEPRRAHGVLQLARARVAWRLSIEPEDGPAVRALTIDGAEPVELSDGFTDLHTRVYEQTLTGRGFGVATARPAVELAYTLRQLGSAR